ncbi:hypothetical protein Desdi_0482 [Desulfitobacterium dichloroeliminans LMG P-21439]|uniref:Uncharacterized protein n=1 Tax=Desulfitobacterium dichloroeliminans (strain LMG P-21439 / DCA1) TaxID=871963 RepID=L0F4T7_DESDL|nr:hypothetical protein Desdi_0482 [Desulfitobacterium dichloroeliminans LMG P-21439]
MVDFYRVMGTVEICGVKGVLTRLNGRFNMYERSKTSKNANNRHLSRGERMISRVLSLSMDSIV